jgi:hypothetical protein
MSPLTQMRDRWPRERQALKRRIRTIVLIWAGWSALMLALPVLTQARFQLARPDNATSWTASDTARDLHAGERGLMRALGPHAAWDSAYYLSIAEHGFDDPSMRAVAPHANPDEPEFAPKAERPDWTTLNHAFFPLYPWAMRVAAWPLSAVGLPGREAALAAGVLVSLLGTLGAMLALADLARPASDGGEPKPDEAGEEIRAAFYLLIWPAAVFLAQVYTEGLFVGLSFGALAMARRRRWAWAAALAALAVWTRSAGAVLIVPFAWRWLADGSLWAIRRNEQRGRVVRDGLLATAPVLAYAAWRLAYGHDFFLVESHYFGRDMLALGRSLESYGQAWDDLMGASGRQASAYQVAEFASVAGGLGASLLIARREPALALYGLAIMALAMTSGAAMGMQRYVLAAPAVYLVAARLGRAPAFDRIWTLAGTLGLAVFTVAFSAGFWAG